MTNTTNTVGCFEYVDFPEFKISAELAKIDTGAYSGALHCTDIKIVRRGGQRVLKFTPLGDVRLQQETANFMTTYVRSASGHRLLRRVVDTTIRLGGKEYAIRIGLSDRSDMKKQVLIGRRFLRDNNILVDVRLNAEYDDEGENTK